MTEGKPASSRNDTCRPGHRLFLCLLVGVVLLNVTVTSLGWARPAELDQAVAMARSGQPAKAIVILNDLYNKNPGDKEVFHDYLTILSWAGMDQRVAELTTRLSPEGAPEYALVAAALSARRRGDYTQAEYLYRAALQRFPGKPELAAGLVLTLVDADCSQSALELADRLEQEHPGDSSLQLAKGYALEARQEFFTALQDYNRVLEQEPANRTAQARRILVLDRLGATDRAVELARQDPDLLSDSEWRHLLNNQAAFAVRGGELPPVDEVSRFAQTDQALVLLEQNRASLGPSNPGAADFDLRTRFDSLVALRNRFRMDEVVGVYQSLVEEQVTIPAYALSAVADAYLYLQKPDRAAALYHQILVVQPDSLDASLGLFYALIELEEFNAAYDLIDRLDQGQPTWLQTRRSDGSTGLQPNPDKVTTATTAAMARLYGDQYAVADTRLTEMHGLAPANLDITRELGDVYAARGWPRQAQQTYELGLRFNPLHRGLQIGLAQSYLDRRQYRLAEQAINRLYTLYPEDVHVRRLYRQWQVHNMRELRLAAGYADNSGNVEGSREVNFAGTLFSRPFSYNYRLFASGRYSSADFPEGKEKYRRYGVGLEYRQPGLEVAAEMTYNADGGDELGGRLSLVYEPDDHWSIPLNIERFSGDTPLRALKSGITADSADLGIRYRASELRQVTLRAQAMDFSDGNFRRSVTGTVDQRLVTLPSYQMRGILELYASANSRGDTIYFNPERDLSASLTMDNLQRLYRRYDRSFSHRLSLTIGNYWQKNYSDDYFAGVTYEHAWEAAERFTLGYGFSRFRRIYDGDPEYQNYCFAHLDWRF